MNTTSLQKPRKTSVDRLRAVGFKPPYLNDQDQLTAICILQNGGVREAPCTKSVFSRIDGKVDRKAGLKMLLDNDFILLLSKSKETGGHLVGIHSFPRNTFRRGLVPAHLENQETVDLFIHSTGDIDVQVIPPKTETRTILSILEKIDELSEIKTGDVLDGRFEVVNIVGNRVSLEIQGK